MGNIQTEVFPFSFISRLLRESKAVNVISMHQPVTPQTRKLCRKVFNEVFMAVSVFLQAEFAGSEQFRFLQFFQKSGNYA